MILSNYLDVEETLSSLDNIDSESVPMLLERVFEYVHSRPMKCK